MKKVTFKMQVIDTACPLLFYVLYFEFIGWRLHGFSV